MTKSQNAKLKQLPKIEQRAIEEFKDRLVEKLGDNLVMLKLYGSKARGDWHKDSDIDLLVVLKKDFKWNDPQSDTLADLDYEIMEKYNFKIVPSVVTYQYNEYIKESQIPTPFLYWVNKEGINLWKTKLI